MTREEQINKMRLEILNDIDDDSKDKIFDIKLDDAEIIALNTLYPFDLEQTKLDTSNKRLANWQVRCAIELYNKIGSANVLSYSENGLSVTYMTGLLSTSLLNELVPKAGVIK